MPLSKFPRPGFPIVPSLLAPYLDRKERRVGRLGDLDSTVWQRFSDKICREVAEVAVKELERLLTSKKRNLRGLKLPMAMRPMRLDDLELQFRTKSRLEALGITRFPDDLIDVTIGGLLDIPYFGVTSIVDFLTSLEHAEKNLEASSANSSRCLPSNLRQLVSKSQGFPQQLLDHWLPQPHETLTLSQLPLSVRTFNALAKANFMNRIRELCQFRAEAVLKIRGFGVGCLINLVEGLYATGATTNVPVDDMAEKCTSSGSPRSNANGSSHLSVPRNIRRTIEDEGLLPLSVQRSRLPRDLLDVRLSNIGLKTRTFQILKRAGLTDNPDRLAAMTVAEIFRLPGCGVESLIDLVECLYRSGDKKKLEFTGDHSEQTESNIQRREPAVVPSDLRKLVRDKGKIPFGFLGCRLPHLPRECSIADLQLPWRAFHSLRSAGLTDDPTTLASTTIGELLELDGIGPHNLCDIVEACHRFSSQPSSSAACAVESFDRLVLRTLVPSGMKRDTAIVSEFLGLCGKSIKTLEQVGQQFKMTRERVRQIYQRHIDDLQGLASKPTWKAVLARLNSLLPCTSKSAAKSLQQEQLIEPGTSLDAVLKVIQLAEENLDVGLMNLGRSRILLKHSHRPFVAQVRKTASRVTLWNGCCSRRTILERLPRDESIPDRPRLISLVLRSMKGFDWLDEDRQWFWYSKAPKLRRRVARVLAVAGRIRLGELRSALRRDLKMRHSMPPTAVLLAICRCLPECETDGEFVWSRRPIEPAQVTRGYELELILLLIEHGPVIGRKRLQEIAVNAGIGLPSLWRCLSFCPTIARYATGVYGLVGANVSPDLIRSIQESEPRIEGGRQDHGWTPDGKVWLAYRLSDGATDTGVISMPSALSTMLSGDYSLKADGLSHVGKLTVKGSSAWGLSPLFRRLSVEPSDTILLTICPKTRHALLKVGDDALLDELAQKQ